MSAFIRFQKKLFLPQDDESRRYFEPIIDIYRIETENIILNTLSLCSKFEDPFEWSISYKFGDVFIGNEYDYDTINRFNIDIRSTEKRSKLLEKVEKLSSDLKTLFPNTIIRMNMLNDLIKDKLNDTEFNYFPMDENFIIINGWTLVLRYSPIIGGKDLESVYIQFSTQEEAIEFRTKIMNEVEDFYKNYASYIKNIVL